MFPRETSLFLWLGAVPEARLVWIQAHTPPLGTRPSLFKKSSSSSLQQASHKAPFTPPHSRDCIFPQCCKMQSRSSQDSPAQHMEALPHLYHGHPWHTWETFILLQAGSSSVSQTLLQGEWHSLAQQQWQAITGWKNYPPGEWVAQLLSDWFQVRLEIVSQLTEPLLSLCCQGKMCQRSPHYAPLNFYSQTWHLEKVLEEIRGEMHDTLSATLGRVIGQGENPPFCQQPGPDDDGRVLGSLKE